MIATAVFVYPDVSPDDAADVVVPHPEGRGAFGVGDAAVEPVGQ